MLLFLGQSFGWKLDLLGFSLKTGTCPESGAKKIRCCGKLHLCTPTPSLCRCDVPTWLGQCHLLHCCHCSCTDALPLLFASSLPLLLPSVAALLLCPVLVFPAPCPFPQNFLLGIVQERRRGLHVVFAILSMHAICRESCSFHKS